MRAKLEKVVSHDDLVLSIVITTIEMILRESGEGIGTDDWPAEAAAADKALERPILHTFSCNEGSPFFIRIYCNSILCKM